MGGVEDRLRAFGVGDELAVDQVGDGLWVTLLSVLHVWGQMGPLSAIQEAPAAIKGDESSGFSQCVAQGADQTVQISGFRALKGGPSWMVSPP